MTQQPFSRPGAIDLSGLKRPARPARPRRRSADGRRLGGRRTPSSVTEQNFQPVLESSMTAPVLLVFFSAPGCPRAASWPTTWPPLSTEFEGRFLAGLVDIDASPGSPRPCRSRRSRWSWSSLDGRPMPLLQDVVPIDELRTALTQVVQQLTAQGITGRHQPRRRSRRAADEDGRARRSTRATPPPRTRSARATSTGAVAEYQKLVDANPADAEAAAGLAMAKVLQRTQGVDLNAARAAAAAEPRRRRRADAGGRPRPARRPRRRRVRPAGRPGPAYLRRRPRPRPRAPARALRAPSATTTRGCCRAAQNLASALF